MPLAGNLGAAWLLVEATTAASALLVGFSGKPRALEAGWKYLVLTTLGLGFALLGIVLLASPRRRAAGSTRCLALARGRRGRLRRRDARRVRADLAGLATKIGWAPVHNWLPDAHSEAPPPVTALLSAALLPTVLLVAWRVEQALEPAVGERHGERRVFIGFGLVSLAVAVPFLWRPLPWKRLLAYSSLEHMGVIALGIGFATPLAIAGVAVHVAGHALAKALGFYAAMPLLGHEPRAAGHAVTGIAPDAARRSAPTMGISLGALAGLPPSPLFLSEMLILRAGSRPAAAWAAAAAAVAARARLPRACARAHRDDWSASARRRDRRSAAGPAAASSRSARRRAVILLALAAAALLAARAPSIVEALRAGCRMTVRRRPRVPRRRSRAALDGRLRAFAGLHALGGGADRARRARRRPTARSGSRRPPPRTGRVPTIVDLAPAAAWDEREAHDLYGVRFDGHEPLRPLVDHDLELARWTVPVRGDDAYQVAVGPIHAGVIESGHFRFHVVGDRILHLDARLFYKHRGLERAAEGSDARRRARATSARACAACAVANGVAYAHAVRGGARARADRRAARARTLLLELERLWNHLNDIAAVCAGVGLAAGNDALRRAQGARAAPQRAPHRAPLPVRHRRASAAARSSSTHARSRAAREELARCAPRRARGWRELQFNASFQDRLPGHRRPRRARTSRGSAPSGPAARAAGVRRRRPRGSPRLAYDGFAPARPSAPSATSRRGSSSARSSSSRRSSCSTTLLDAPVAPGGGGRHGAASARSASGASRARAARRSASSSATATASTRLRLRTGSYANWPAVAHAAAGQPAARTSR